ncbi:hypothetical protein CYMTET_23586 [Cymbomonas tetramitiformis]|uniref:Uncharacterized protein n=1 Tax=Cymbomonas tetramitiformis TaxID=36881 RepID=A0AAE0FY04_9CHLO|nr:hypothetical protein CYMTET_23586 [Cymbomonas tetramitiformis]
MFVISFSALRALVFRSRALLELSDHFLESLEHSNSPLPPQPSLMPHLLVLALPFPVDEFASATTSTSTAPPETVADTSICDSETPPISTSYPKALIRTTSGAELCWEHPTSATLEEVAQCAASQLQCCYEISCASSDESRVDVDGAILTPWRRANHWYFALAIMNVLYETFGWNYPVYQPSLLNNSYQRFSGLTFAAVEGSCYVLFGCIFSLMRWSQLIIAARVQKILHRIHDCNDMSITSALRSIRDLAHDVRKFSDIFEPYLIASSMLTTTLILVETAIYVYNIVQGQPIEEGDEVGVGFLFMLLYFWGTPLYISWDVNKVWKRFLEDVNELKVESGRRLLRVDPESSALSYPNLEVMLKYAERKEIGFRCFGIVVGRDWLQRTTFINIFITFLGALSIKFASYVENKQR